MLVAVDGADADDALERLGRLLVLGREALAVAAPRRVELDHPDALAVHHAVLEVVGVLGANSIDTLNFRHKTGPHSGPNSVLGHSKFRHVSKLQKRLGQGSGGPTKMSIELHPSWAATVVVTLSAPPVAFPPTILNLISCLWSIARTAVTKV